MKITTNNIIPIMAFALFAVMILNSFLAAHFTPSDESHELNHELVITTHKGKIIIDGTPEAWKRFVQDTQKDNQ